MNAYDYYLVNVFAKTHFSGNPLAVFPKAQGLNDKQMQAIAKQFNLSETAFVFDSTDNKAVANLRIFTPEYELPLAGHPVLGSAFILKKLQKLPNDFVLNTTAKPVDITSYHNHIAMKITGFDYKISKATADELAMLVNLGIKDIDTEGFWINCGSSQLFLKVTNKNSLFKATINKDMLINICQKDNEQQMICLWAMQNDVIFVRFFFIQNGIVIQDSGTGSACANLGAYFILKNTYPLTKCVYQGDDIGRPNRLTLSVNDKKHIQIGGDVIKVGKGEFYLP